MARDSAPTHGEPVTWAPEKPSLRPGRLLVTWLLASASLVVAAAIVPGVEVESFWGALLVAAVIAVLNAIVPPVIAALRLPFMVAIGFIGILLVDAALLLLLGDWLDDVTVGSFGDALLMALVIAAVGMVLQVIAGTNDDDEYMVRVIRRVARR